MGATKEGSIFADPLLEIASAAPSSFFFLLSLKRAVGTKEPPPVVRTLSLKILTSCLLLPHSPLFILNECRKEEKKMKIVYLLRYSRKKEEETFFSSVRLAPYLFDPINLWSEEVREDFSEPNANYCASLTS